MPLTPDHVIENLGLEPHPEGGFFREVHRAELEIEHPGIEEAPRARAASTAIYYLLTAGDFSAFHRVTVSEEAWHFYAGDPLELHTLGPSGHERRLLADDLGAGEPLAVVPAGHWQAARVAKGGAWSLCGCTVAPGFDFADFEMGQRASLVAAFPRCADVIRAFTRPSP